jgi:phosphoribosylanthranilate isomerase
MFRIKICGITSPGDALMVAEAGADAIGLNFYEESPRYVTPQLAEKIVEELRGTYSDVEVAVYGVFVNATLDDILWIIRDANLYANDRGLGLQLHGDEPPELLRQMHDQGLGTAGDLLQAAGHVPEVPITRAFRCRGGDLSQEAEYLEKCRKLGALPQAVLLDAYAPGAYGGTGQVVDWLAVAKARPSLAGLPLILAGGLTPDNVAEAIAVAQPHAVDVASGVESSSGSKDFAKVWRFITAAKKAFEGG